MPYFYRAIFYRYRNQLWLAVGFVLLLIFFWLVPSTGDDFTFASFARSIHGVSDFIEANTYLHTRINGRVLGNSIELFLSSHPILSALFRACITLSIVVLAIRLLKIKTLPVKLLLSTVLFAAPITIFHQTFAWQAGFINYVTPVALILLILAVLAKHIDNRQHRDSYGTAALLLTASFACTLFAENITVILLFSSICLLLWSLRKRKHLVKAATALLLGSGAGAFVMFSSPVYRTVASGQDKYRQIGAGDGPVSVLTDNFLPFANLLVSHNVLLFLIITVTCTWLVLRGKGAVLFTRQKFMPGLIVACLTLSSFFLLFFDLNTQTVWGHGTLMLVRVLFEMLSVALLFTCIGLVVIWFVHDKTARTRATVFLVGALAFAAPLLFVTPFGGRNFYLSYVLLVLFAGTVLKYIAQNESGKIRLNYSFLQWPCYAIFLFVAAFYLLIFGLIHREYARNMASAKQQIDRGDHVVSLNFYSFNEYLHDPHNEMKTQFYLANGRCTYAACKGGKDIIINFE